MMAASFFGVLSFFDDIDLNVANFSNYSGMIFSSSIVSDRRLSCFEILYMVEIFGDLSLCASFIDSLSEC